MHPDLIPGFPLKTYGCCMAVGFLLAWQVIAWFCRRTHRDMGALSNLITGLILAGVLGSRVAYVIEHWSGEFAHDPISVFHVWKGGLMFYGGFILAVALFFGWCRKKRENVLALADLLLCAVPLGHACGRIGCFFYGCCYGKLSSAWCAVSFPGGSPASHEQAAAGLIASSRVASLPVLPTQLFEAAANLALFALLFFLYRQVAVRRTYAGRFGPGVVAGAYLCGYAVIRFALEYLRGDPRAAVWIFSISQTISIGIFAAGLAFFGWSVFGRRTETVSAN